MHQQRNLRSERSVDRTIKVLIADDHPLILQGLRRTLESCEDIEVVGEAREGTEVPPLVERRAPDVVLMDLRMPGLDGVECIRAIKAAAPEVKAVLLTASEERSAIDAAIAAGASGYVLKSVSALDVPSVVRQVAAGYTMFHRPAAEAAASGAETAALTEREATILAAVADGKTTRTISSELWVSEHTVKFHLTNIYRKLGVSNRSAAVRYAFEHGLADARG
ncbi:MAG TPA: response regulator transcription factor [Solirubrobacteraceae bacterium]|nr:response regulator transcription factor [Solirubrobacteraceae bacterium]